MHGYQVTRVAVAAARCVAICSVLALVTVPDVQAGDPVVIKIKTQPVTTINAGFSGFNVPQPRNGVEYYDSRFLTAVTPLGGGWVRFPGGTDSLDFEWSTGHTNIDWMNSLIGGNPPEVSGQAQSILTMSQQLTQAKGGVYFSDFAAFAKALNAWAVVCFNSYTDTNTGSATQMVQAAESYGLNVQDWELGNEAYLYPLIYSTPAAYAKKSHNYFGEIRAGSPATRISLFPAGWYPGAQGCIISDPCFLNWDSGLEEYPALYWNAASNHIYPIVGAQTTQNTMWALNGVLAHGSTDYMNSYLVPLVGTNTPIYITEFNCCSSYSNKFLSYLYNGIFLAEYIARLSSVPNVKGVAINSLYTDNTDYHGLIQSMDDYESYLLGQLALYGPDWWTDTATDPNTVFQFYTSAPGLAIEVANQAINSGTHIWPTTVEGGPTVKITGFDGNPVPAVYAQMYLGANGSHYLLITNKSSEGQKVTIELNGAPVQGTFNLTYVANSVPFRRRIRRHLPRTCRSRPLRPATPFMWPDTA